MPYFFRCPKCSQQFQVGENASGKRFKCPCGNVATIPVPAAAVEEAEPTKAIVPERPQRTTHARSSRHWTRTLLLLLLACYFPFLGCLCLAVGGMGAWLIWFGVSQHGESIFSLPALALGGIVALSVLHLIWGLRALFRKDSEKDQLEFELPHEWQSGLVHLAEQVAEERGLHPPDVIRLHAVDLAKVYEDKRGRTVLVLGGVAIAAFSQKTLGGIVAHELGHSFSGDTSLSRMATRWHQVMIQLEYGFWRRWWYRANPLTWLVKLYHRLYVLVWYANSRQQEYAADRHEVALVGKQDAGAALMLVTLLHSSAFTELGGVAEAIVETNQRLDRIFAEQVRRVQVTSLSDWEDIAKKQLRHKTGWHDSHPALKDRLHGMGIAPKKALKAMMTMLSEPGKPATDLFVNWPVVEKFLTDRILTIVREYYAAKAEAEAIAQAIARSMQA